MQSSSYTYIKTHAHQTLTMTMFKSCLINFHLHALGALHIDSGVTVMRTSTADWSFRFHQSTSEPGPGAKLIKAGESPTIHPSRYAPKGQPPPCQLPAFN